MIEVVNKLMDELRAGNIAWLVLFLSGGIIWHCITNFKQIQDFLHARRKQKVDRLIEVLKCEHLDEPFKKFLQSQLNKEYWYYVTDISTENKYRDLIISLYNSSKGELSFNHFRRANRHLKFADGKVSIVLKWLDTFGYYMNFGIAIFFGLAGLLVICLSLAVVQPDDLLQILPFVALSGFSIVIALFSLSQTAAVYSARVIKKLIDNQSAQS